MTPDLTVLLGVLGLALATMPVYAMSTARATADPHEVVDRGGFVLGGFVRSWFYWFIGPLVRFSLALKISPAFFNLLGVAFGIGAGVAFGTGHVTLGGWGVRLGGAAEVLDGRIARGRDIRRVRRNRSAKLTRGCRRPIMEPLPEQARDPKRVQINWTAPQLASFGENTSTTRERVGREVNYSLACVSC